MDIEVEEAQALGMRMTVTRGSMNLSQKDGGLPPDSVVQDEDEILADSERAAGALSRPLGRCDAAGRARALLALLGDQAPDERERRARRALRLPACTPIWPRPKDEDAFCLRHVWLPAARLSGGGGLAAARAPGSRTASISPARNARRSAGTASASAIARPPTWCSPRASAGRGNWRRRARRSASASTARPPTTIPT